MSCCPDPHSSPQWTALPSSSKSIATTIEGCVITERGVTFANPVVTARAPRSLLLSRHPVAGSQWRRGAGVARDSQVGNKAFCQLGPSSFATWSTIPTRMAWTLPVGMRVALANAGTGLPCW